MAVQDRRRYRRLPIGLKLEVDRLFKQDYVELSALELELEVIDISKSGIGFITTKEIPLNYYFNACIHLEEKEFFRTVIKIVRCEPFEEGELLYGCEFVGLAAFLATKVDEYEKKLNRYPNIAQ